MLLSDKISFIEENKEELETFEMDSVSKHAYPHFDRTNFIQLERVGNRELGLVFKAWDYKRKEFVSLKFVEVKNFDVYEESTFQVQTKEENKSCIIDQLWSTYNYFDEGLILSKLRDIKSPDFIQFFGAFQDSEEGKTRLIFELELGEATLADIVFYRKKYPEKELFYIISNVVNQLWLAQKHHISHGDINLADIVTFKNDNKLIYKLVDFGFGHILPNDILSSYDVKGYSYLYSSPELRRTSLDHHFLMDPYKSDIYALGVVILKLMGVDNDRIDEIQKVDGQLTKEFCKEYSKYPKSCELVQNFFQVTPGKRFSYQEILDFLSQCEIDAPNDTLYINNTKQKQTAAMTEIDIEKYVKLYQELGNFLMSRQYCYVAYNTIKGSNYRREAFWREKCGDCEAALKYYDEAEKSYFDAISLLMNMNNDFDETTWVINLQNKRLEIKKIKSTIIKSTIREIEKV